MLDLLAGLGLLYLIYVIIAWMIGLAIWVGGVIFGAAIVAVVLVISIVVYVTQQMYMIFTDTSRRRRNPLAGGRWH